MAQRSVRKTQPSVTQKNQAETAQELAWQNELLQDTIEQMRVVEEELLDKNEILLHNAVKLHNDCERYRELFDSTPEAYLVTDSAGIIRDCNRRAALLLAKVKRFLLRRALLTLVPSEHRPEFLANLQRLAAGADRIEWETRLQPLGNQPIDVRMTVVSYLAPGGETLLLWLLRDMTAQKSLEKERDLAQAVAVACTREAAILEERNRIAQEIHDTLAQIFTGVRLQLEVAEDCLDVGSEQARAHLIRAREIALEGFAETHRSVHALRPQLLQGSSLREALARILDQMIAGTGIACQFLIQGVPLSLSQDVEANLLRIGQEAVTNALRHAHAKDIRVELVYDQNAVHLAIHDTGQGFDMAAPREGFGLASMRKRAQDIGGQWHVFSAAGQGTQINVTVPVAAHEEMTDSIPDRQ